MRSKRRSERPVPSIGTALAVLLVAVTVGCTAIVDRFSGRKEACEILAIGTPAKATITKLVDTGTTINDDPVVEFVLEVSAPDGGTFEARTEALVSRLDVPQVQPGRVVPVKFDPNDRSRVALDLWSCEGR